MCRSCLPTRSRNSARSLRPFSGRKSRSMPRASTSKSASATRKAAKRRSKSCSARARALHRWSHVCARWPPPLPSPPLSHHSQCTMPRSLQARSLRELADATADTAGSDIEQFKNRVIAENLDRFADAQILLYEKGIAIYKAQKELARLVPATPQKLAAGALYTGTDQTARVVLEVSEYLRNIELLSSRQMTRRSSTLSNSPVPSSAPSRSASLGAGPPPGLQHSPTTPHSPPAYTALPEESGGHVPLRPLGRAYSAVAHMADARQPRLEAGRRPYSVSPDDLAASAAPPRPRDEVPPRSRDAVPPRPSAAALGYDNRLSRADLDSHA
eukprot:m.88164 g.88164  ORF g.88164 m.88164 type:complete len:328 (-) comp8353_c0_seq2:200-1183(-)